jgi:hypothetical protein
MADDGTPRRPAGPEPASDAKKHANKLVVLSSVEKEPLNEAESLLGEASTDPKAPPVQPGDKPADGLIRPVGWTTRPGGTTTIIKLPPKTGVLPRLTSLSPKNRPQPPPLPKQTQPAMGDDDTKRLPPIKLQASALPAASESESIFSSGSDMQASKSESPAAPPVASGPADKKKETQPLKSVFASQPSQPAPGTETLARPEALPHPASLIHHAPPLVPHDASAPASEEESAKTAAPLITPVDGKKAELAQAMDSPTPYKPAAISAAAVPLGEQVTQRLLPATGAAPSSPARPLPGVESQVAENETKKMRLPPRAATSARLKKTPEVGDASGLGENPADATTPPKVFPVAPPASATRAPVKATTTPPTIPLRPAMGATKPLITPVVAASAALAASAVLPPADPDGFLKTGSALEPGGREKKPVLPSTRAARMRKRRIIGIVAFYIIFVALLPCLYFAGIYFSRETRMEGQIIPPPGMVLGNEAFIVTDFSDLSAGIASDLASDRMIVMQDMQEKQAHVQRAQADVAAREARIRQLSDQAKVYKQEQIDLVKQARAASQQIWNGPGAELDAEYQSKLGALNEAIAARAKSLKLQYTPDPNFFSPEVWASAYRLALYQVPAGVDTVKERLWLDQQMKNWRDFTKSMDQRQTELREQATQLKLAPATKVADLKTLVDDLQTRIDGTLSEEEPLKAELEQAQADLAAVQKKEGALDAKPLEKLDALPDANITKRLQLNSSGRFSWREMEKESKYSEDEKSHVYWIFSRAYRSGDGRQYWALHRFTVDKDSTAEIMIEPDSFASTKSILRPDLPPDEQSQ